MHCEISRCKGLYYNITVLVQSLLYTGESFITLYECLSEVLPGQFYQISVAYDAD